MSNRRLLRLAVWLNLIAAALFLFVAVVDLAAGKRNVFAVVFALTFGCFGLFLRRLAQQV